MAGESTCALTISRSCLGEDLAQMSDRCNYEQCWSHGAMISLLQVSREPSVSAGDYIRRRYATVLILVGDGGPPACVDDWTPHAAAAAGAGDVRTRRIGGRIDGGASWETRGKIAATP